jgi:hypothetical protein
MDGGGWAAVAGERERGGGESKIKKKIKVV